MRIRFLILLLSALSLAIPACSQSPIALSPSSSRVTFTATQSGAISAQLGVCSGIACTMSASTSLGTATLTSTGQLGLMATSQPGVFQVTQNGSLLFSQATSNGAAISGQIRLLDFVQSPAGAYAVGTLQASNAASAAALGGSALPVKLFFDSPVDLSALAGGCDSSASPASQEYVGSTLSSAGSHANAQFCPKLTAHITLAGLNPPGKPKGQPGGGPLPTPEPASLLLLVSGLFTTRALIARFRP